MRSVSIPNSTPISLSFHDKTPLSKAGYAIDVRIDALVYELYGLTAEEIAVVEESVAK